MHYTFITFISAGRVMPSSRSYRASRSALDNEVDDAGWVIRSSVLDGLCLYQDPTGHHGPCWTMRWMMLDGSYVYQDLKGKRSATAVLRRWRIGPAQVHPPQKAQMPCDEVAAPVNPLRECRMSFKLRC
jgi:hypothetical protein